MASSYQKGYRLELEVRDLFRAYGFFAVRTPGSKTPVDVIAMNKREDYLVQCKYGNSRINPKEMFSLWGLCDELAKVPVYAIKHRGGPIKLYRVVCYAVDPTPAELEFEAMEFEI